MKKKMKSMGRSRRKKGRPKISGCFLPSIVETGATLRPAPIYLSIDEGPRIWLAGAVELAAGTTRSWSGVLNLARTFTQCIGSGSPAVFKYEVKACHHF